MGVPYAEVIGDPVAHSKSPTIHNFWLQRMGIEAEYRATRVAAAEIGAFLNCRRADSDWRGCNVTIPHKIAVLPHLDESFVDWIGAANCIVRMEGRLIGHNTDATGIGKALSLPIDTGAPVCIIGAGGAARAAIAQLDIAAVFQFNVVARDPVKARAAIDAYEEYGRVFPFDEAAVAMRGCVGLINASPLGMEGFEPMPASVLDSLPLLARGAFVLDMVYVPLRTQLLCRAEAVRRHWFSSSSGFHVADGLTMLIGQAEESFSLLFGMTPPHAHRAALRELLAL